jgi:hypothetical protein
MITENDIKVGDVVEWLGTSGHSTKDGVYTKGKSYTIEDVAVGAFTITDDRGCFLWVTPEDFKKITNTISLKLSLDEAQALADVLTLVDGHNGDSRVVYILDIQQLLATLGFKQSEIDDCSGSIYFEQTKEETVEYNGNTYNKAAFDAMLNTLEKL